jgi:hypothetical protein
MLSDILGHDLHVGNRPAAGTGDDVPFEAKVERPHRQDDYRQAIRSGMSELLRAIRRGEPLTVTPDDGLHSLEAALRATEGGLTA